jgi:hypothetical protein
MSPEPSRRRPLAPRIRQLFVWVIGLLVVYMLITRGVGMAFPELDPSWKRYLKWSMGLVLMAGVLWLYIRGPVGRGQSPPEGNDATGPAGEPSNAHD